MEACLTCKHVDGKDHVLFEGGLIDIDIYSFW